MTPHDELDLLSASLDGELDASEQARLETHLTTCAECRATLDGIKATLADLRSLPEAAPAPQDSWALRAAIRRARSPMRKWQRLSWAAGAVAAAAITFAAVTLPGGGGDAGGSAALEAASGSRVLATVPIYQSGQNLSASDAQARLLDVAGIVPGAKNVPAPAPERATSGQAGGYATDSAFVATPNAQAADRQLFATSGEDDASRAAIERCVSGVRESTQDFLEPLQYELATFEDKPSFLLFFRSGDRYELWVVARADCTVLYFGQA